MTGLATGAGSAPPAGSREPSITATPEPGGEARARPPVDPRLLKHAVSARWFFLLGAVLGGIQVLAIVAFSWLLASAIAGAVDGASLAELAPRLLALGGAVLVRATAGWLLDAVAVRGGARVKSELRMRVLDALEQLGPRGLRGRRGTELSTLAGQGLDALDAYFARFLPQLVLTVVSIGLLVPLLIWQDALTGITVLVTLPLIPVFMVLIGWATQSMQRKQWVGLQQLSRRFLDVVEGLPTLKLYGREQRQVRRIAEITDGYRSRTMSVLRVTFLSGFVLELASSLAVALVAVSIGIRLIAGDLELGVGLFVLLLAPEVFLPLRQVGAQFHASAEGQAAAADVFVLLDEAAASEARRDAASAAGRDAAPAAAERTAPGARAAIDAWTATGERTDTGATAVPAVTAVLAVRGLSAGYAEAPILLDLSLEAVAGELTVLGGPSGSGKSTLLAALLGFVDTEGIIELDGVRLSAERRRGTIAWAGQRPQLTTGTLRENVLMGATVDEEVLAEALRRADAAQLELDRPLGAAGAGLSGGQAQRAALARAHLRALDRDARILLVDEPSSALDEHSEQAVIAGLRAAAAEGRIVLAVSHRPALIAAADRVYRLDAEGVLR